MKPDRATFFHPAAVAARVARHAAVLQRRRIYNREYYRRNLGVPRVPRPKPVVPAVHQLIRTFPPILPGTIALSFWQYRVIAR